MFDYDIDIFFPLDRAVGALADSKDFVEDLLKGKTVDLSFQGIDHFKNEVAFVQLAENDHTAVLSEIAGTTCEYNVKCLKDFLTTLWSEPYLDCSGAQIWVSCANLVNINLPLTTAILTQLTSQHIWKGR